MKVGGQVVSFVHFDTSFLAYGKSGEAGNQGMR